MDSGKENGSSSDTPRSLFRCPFAAVWTMLLTELGWWVSRKLRPKTSKTVKGNCFFEMWSFDRGKKR